VSRSIVMRGIRGARLLADMMKSLRDNPPAELGGMKVLSRQDFLSDEHGPIRSETDRLSRNFLLFQTERAQIVIRPSGTEPKAKVYVDLEGAKLPGAPDRGKASRAAHKLAAQVMDECIARIGFHLGVSAHRLPDYVDLDLKVDFDGHFRRDLIAAADTLSRRTESEQLQWLRDRLKPFGGGTDPLGPTAAALSNLLEDICLESPAIEPACRILGRTVAGARTPVDWVF